MEFLLLVPILALTSWVTAAIVRRKARRGESSPAGSESRYDALERTVEQLQRELSETQERLDFAERMLTQSRQERRLES